MDSVRGDLEFREGLPQLSGLRPVFSPQAKITQLRLRGHVWYVAQDPVSLQYFRFGPIEHAVVKLLDGQRTLREVHLALQRQFGAEAPGFQDIVSFVQMMRSANLLQAADAQDLDALYKRVSKRRSQRHKNLLANFLFLTIPLYDPDRFLARTVEYVRFLFTGWFLAVWLGVVLTGIVVGFANLGELARPAEGVLSPDNLMLLWLCFVGLKVIHEFSHAYLAKHYGSEVHRMGILFLVFTPSAYVDVTGLWSVENKHSRALVGAAGMMAELFLASLALFVWLATEPGTLHSVAYNVIFIASVSSVLFNGNPLLRYDGYYILSDWAEFPNLWQNARNYLLYLGKHYLLGIDQPSPTEDSRERIWFIVYGICSWIYRTLVVIGIILFISSALFGLGLALGVAAVVVWIIIPIGMLFHYLLFAQATRPHRLRCVAVLALLLTAGVVPITQIPVPQYIYAPCVFVEQERATVRARWGGFVDQVVAHDGEWVKAGQLIAVCTNEELAYDVVRTSKALDISRIRLAAYDQDGNVAAAQVERSRIPTLEENLRVLGERVESLRLTAPCAGQLIAPDLANWPGRFLKPGAPLALLARGPFTRIVVVMDQSGIADVQRMPKVAGEAVPPPAGPTAPARGHEGEAPDQAFADVRFESQTGRMITCPITKILPQATQEVPSPSLTHQAGGPIVLDPSAPEGNRTLLPWFSVELELPGQETPPPLGTRGEARFEIGRRPLAQQWYYKLLRLLRTKYLI